MNIKKIFFMTCFIILIFGVAGVTAGDMNDTAIASDGEVHMLEQTNKSVTDSINNDALGEVNDVTFSALQDKISNAEEGSTITLDKDYSYDDGFDKRGIVIDKDITIDGNGHSLDGAGQARIFLVKLGKIKNHQITLKNIKFTNAKTGLYGGAIFNYAHLTVENCEFASNYAKYAGGAIASIGHLNCINSKFIKNTADGDGGAIFCLSFKLHLDLVNLLGDTILDGNLTYLFNFPSYLSLKFVNDTISNSIFTSNIANGRGGGAVYAFGSIDIKSSAFTSNQAGEKGGAVFGNKDLFISNSKFTNNQASKSGGAVYFKCHANSGHYDKNKNWVSEVEYYSNLIQGSTFTKNKAAKGGAIYGFKSSSSDKHEAKAVKCTFEANKASKGRDIYGGTATKSVFNYLKLTLKKVKVKKSAKKLVLTAKLTKGKKLVSGKKITFKFNGKTYKAKTNKKGIAKVTIKKSILKKLKVGKKIKYQAKYGKLTVKKTAKAKK
ncbi:pectate lyase-like adhesive domain-containing protein [Methanobrevibacter sp.]